MTDKKQGANRHPASDNPIKKPDPNRDGINPSSVLAQQIEKNWLRRDDPERDLS